MESSRRLKILLCYPIGDPDGAQALELLSPFHDVIWSGSDRLRSPLRVGLEQGARQADLCVAVLSRSGVASRSETYFAIGIALAIGTPTLLVAAQRKPPRFLRELPFLSLVALRKYPDALQSIPTPRSEQEHENDLFALDPDENFALAEADPRSRRIRSENELQAEVASLFQNLGAQIRWDEQGSKVHAAARPDLVIWEDSLLQEFGLPLPVEIKSQSLNSRSHLTQFRAILKATGAQTLLVVSGQPMRPLSWSDASGLVLTVWFWDLKHASEQHGLTGAMRELLARSNDDQR